MIACLSGWSSPLGSVSMQNITLLDQYEKYHLVLSVWQSSLALSAWKKKKLVQSFDKVIRLCQYYRNHLARPAWRKSSDSISTKKYHLALSVWKTSLGSVSTKSTQSSRIKKFLKFLTLEDVPTGCPEMSVSNIAERRISHLCFGSNVVPWSYSAF